VGCTLNLLKTELIPVTDLPVQELSIKLLAQSSCSLLISSIAMYTPAPWLRCSLLPPARKKSTLPIPRRTPSSKLPPGSAAVFRGPRVLDHTGKTWKIYRLWRQHRWLRYNITSQPVPRMPNNWTRKYLGVLYEGDLTRGTIRE